MPSSKELAKQLKDAEKNLECVRKENEKNRMRRQKEQAEDASRLDKADEKIAALHQKMKTAEAEEAAKSSGQTVKALRKEIGDKMADKVAAGQFGHLVQRLKISSWEVVSQVFGIALGGPGVTSGPDGTVTAVFDFDKLAAVFGSSKAESNKWGKKTKVTRATMEWETSSGWMTLRINNLEGSNS
eukprot:g306.t1